MGAARLAPGSARRPRRAWSLATACAVAVASLAFPALASAHATLLRTIPADGAVLDHAPNSVRVIFDDTVRVAGGNTVVDNGSRASVLEGKAVARGHVVTLPLRTDLRDGDYTVRWSIVSDDGHREQGVLAFAVGQGRAPPRAVLGASAPLSGIDLLLRTLYFLGILVGGGAAVFGLLARSELGERLLRPLAHLLFFALLATFLGASGMVHGAVPARASRSSCGSP